MHRHQKQFQNCFKIKAVQKKHLKDKQIRYLFMAGQFKVSSELNRFQLPFSTLNMQSFDGIHLGILWHILFLSPI